MKIYREPKIDKKEGKKINKNNAVDDGAHYLIHLTNAESVRRLLSSTVNELRGNKIAVDRARAIIYASTVLLTTFEQCDLEERIAKLEELSKYGGN